MPAHLIFWPMVAHAFLVFVLYAELGRRRFIEGKRGSLDVEDFKVLKPSSDTSFSGAAARAVINNFEMPVLFHAAALVLFSLDAVAGAVLTLAWVFVAARVLQALVHLAHNNVAHRALFFFLSVFMTLGLWICVIMKLVSV